MGVAHVAAVITNPGSYTNPTNVNDRNDGTSATKALTTTPIHVVNAAIETSDYSTYFGTVPRAFGFRVKHACTTSGDAVGKLLTVDVSYSINGGASYIGTFLTHSIADAALTFDDDRYQFIATPADLSQLALRCTVSIVANSGGSVTLNHTVYAMELFPLLPPVGSMLGFM